jgi:hypothetical protein
MALVEELLKKLELKDSKSFIDESNHKIYSVDEVFDNDIDLTKLKKVKDLNLEEEVIKSLFEKSSDDLAAGDYRNFLDLFLFLRRKFKNRVYNVEKSMNVKIEVK